MLLRDNIPKLDCHGVLEDKIFDVLDRFIRNNVTKEEIEVVVGKGKGIIKKRVIEYLKIAGYSWRYSRSSTGAINEGAIIVEISEV